MHGSSTPAARVGPCRTQRPRGKTRPRLYLYTFIILVYYLYITFVRSIRCFSCRRVVRLVRYYRRTSVHTRAYLLESHYSERVPTRCLYNMHGPERRPTIRRDRVVFARHRGRRTADATMWILARVPRGVDCRRTVAAKRVQFHFVFSLSSSFSLSLFYRAPIDLVVAYRETIYTYSNRWRVVFRERNHIQRPYIVYITCICVWIMWSSSGFVFLTVPFSQARSDSMASVYSGAGEGRYGTVPVRGEVEFGLQYNYKAAQFEINIKHCRDLAAADPKRNRSDPWVPARLPPNSRRNLPNPGLNRQKGVSDISTDVQEHEKTVLKM